MARSPFDMLRACFWLLAVIIMIMVGESALALATCGYLVLVGTQKVGVCVETGVVGQAREILELSLTTVLALLLAARGPPGGPPPPPPEDDRGKLDR
jgi:hypothetical protein